MSLLPDLLLDDGVEGRVLLLKRKEKSVSGLCILRINARFLHDFLKIVASLIFSPELGIRIPFMEPNAVPLQMHIHITGLSSAQEVQVMILSMIGTQIMLSSPQKEERLSSEKDVGTVPVRLPGKDIL